MTLATVNCRAPMTHGRLRVQHHYKIFGLGPDIAAMEAFSIEPFRCPECGLLSFYALEKVDLS